MTARCFTKAIGRSRPGGWSNRLDQSLFPVEASQEFRQSQTVSPKQERSSRDQFLILTFMLSIIASTSLPCALIPSGEAQTVTSTISALAPSGPISR